MFAWDMYASNPLTLEPTPDSRLAPDWALRGYIVGVDELFRSTAGPAIAPARVCYGYVAESIAHPGQFAAAIRGTANPIEWAEDGEFFQVTTPWPGKVEAGFYGIYGSLAFLTPSGADEPLVPALIKMVSTGSLTAVGHSLGSPLATMLAYALAPALGARVALRVFASPHPGDGDFVTGVAAAVPDHVHYANTLDIVRRVPVGFGYSQLPNTVEVPPRAQLVRIKIGSACLHHLICYLALIDPSSADSAAETPIDAQNAACIVRLNAPTHVLASLKSPSAP